MFQVMLDHPQLVLVPVVYLVSTHVHKLLSGIIIILHNTDITDLAEVKRCLKKFTDWMSLGLELCLYHTTLKSIEKEECRDVEKCKTEMLAGWLEKRDNVASVCRCPMLLGNPGKSSQKH